MVFNNQRNSIIEKLSRIKDNNPGNIGFYHGKLAKHLQESPSVVWGSTELPSDQMRCSPPAWLTAAEFEDSVPSLEAKTDILVQLLQSSRNTLVYAGCGLSTSVGVAQTARGQLHMAGGQFPTPRSGLTPRGKLGTHEKRTEAKPGASHFTLTSLYRNNFIGKIICLNHDGLLQKAGCPQEGVIEVFGSWFDPSNPVVKAGGTIRQDLWEKTKLAAENVDLVLVIGTSLSGLPTDFIVEKNMNCPLGVVIINLQQSRLDGGASLRIFSEADQVMKMISVKLRLKHTIPKISHKMKTHALVPYCKDGDLSDRFFSCLDMTSGNMIRLHRQHNCQGSNQSAKSNIKVGEGRIEGYCTVQRAWKLRIEGVPMLLGYWWMLDAVRGGPDMIPIINIVTNMQESKDPEENWRVRCKCQLM